MICPNCKGQTEEEGVDCFVCRALVEPTPKPTEEGPYTDNGMSPSAFKYKVLGPGVDEEMFHLQMETTNSTKLPVFLLNFGFSQGAASRDEEISGMKERAMMDKAEIAELKAKLHRTEESSANQYERANRLESNWQKLKEWIEEKELFKWDHVSQEAVLAKMAEIEKGEK
jgi:hypothetical protein